RHPELSIINSTRIAALGLRFMVNANGLGNIKRLVSWFDVPLSERRPYGPKGRNRSDARAWGGDRVLGVLLR
ncbi:MAG: hypothetical protein VYD23_00785, partial [Candidatus Thermoplasmatota archaeon]|nr:hypothetical protein [Candidatus Thermoplasmatota archaeon]